MIYIWTESRRALHASFVTSPVWAKGNGHQHRRVASLIMHGRLARHFHFLFFFFSELLAIARATFVLQESTATMRRSIPWAVLVARAAVRRRRRRPVGAYRTHAHRFFLCVCGGWVVCRWASRRTVARERRGRSTWEDKGGHSGDSERDVDVTPTTM